MTEATEVNAQGNALHPGIEVKNAMTETTAVNAQGHALQPGIKVNNAI